MKRQTKVAVVEWILAAALATAAVLVAVFAEQRRAAAECITLDIWEEDIVSLHFPNDEERVIIDGYDGDAKIRWIIDYRNRSSSFVGYAASSRNGCVYIQAIQNADTIGELIDHAVNSGANLDLMQ